MSRLAELQPSEMSAAQRKVHDDIMSGPRAKVMNGFPPLFQPWLRSPDLADHAQRLGAFVRLESSLPPHISEFAILITARHWRCAYEWATHAPIAQRAGIDPTTIADIAADRRPAFADPQLAAVYDFCIEVHERRFVSDETFTKALDFFDERGLVELVAVLGYYTLAAMTLNTFEMGHDAKAPWLE